MIIHVYSDGSSDGKSGNKTGYGYVILLDGVKIHEGCGSEASGSNNSAEISGAIAGLSWVDSYIKAGSSSAPAEGTLRDVVLRSDSQLVLGYASGRYQCKARHLLPLYLEVRRLFIALNVKDEWVKGHSGNEWNERCDELSNVARLAP